MKKLKLFNQNKGRYHLFKVFLIWFEKENKGLYARCADIFQGSIEKIQTLQVLPLSFMCAQAKVDNTRVPEEA